MNAPSSLTPSVLGGLDGGVVRFKVRQEGLLLLGAAPGAGANLGDEQGGDAREQQQGAHLGSCKVSGRESGE